MNTTEFATANITKVRCQDTTTTDPNTHLRSAEKVSFWYETWSFNQKTSLW